MINKQYFGFGLKQRQEAGSLVSFAFYARAKDVYAWTGVKRNAEIARGAQRVLIPARVKAIKRFITSSSINIVPGAILIAFNEGVANLLPLTDTLVNCMDAINISNGCDDLVFPAQLNFNFDDTVAQHERPAMIVDGQHRLAGLSAYELENIPLLIVALIDATLMEQAFQFVVINNKSARVATTDVKSIIADIDEEVLQERLLTAGIKYGEKSPMLRDINDLEDSPFQKLLEWSYNSRQGGTPLVPLTAIEQSIRYISSMFESALAGRYHEGDDDSLLQIFMSIWNGVKKRYPDLWGHQNKLMNKVSINALNEILTDKLKSGWKFDLVDIFDDPRNIENFIMKQLKNITPEFWTSEWTVTIQDNANIRKLIKYDLELLDDNLSMGKHWYTDLKLPVVVNVSED